MGSGFHGLFAFIFSPQKVKSDMHGIAIISYTPVPHPLSWMEVAPS